MMKQRRRSKAKSKKKAKRHKKQHDPLPEQPHEEENADLDTKRGGTMSVMAPHATLQGNAKGPPKANILFPELTDAIFALEVHLA